MRDGVCLRIFSTTGGMTWRDSSRIRFARAMFGSLLNWITRAFNPSSCLAILLNSGQCCWLLKYLQSSMMWGSIWGILGRASPHARLSASSEIGRFWLVALLIARSTSSILSARLEMRSVRPITFSGFVALCKKYVLWANSHPATAQIKNVHAKILKYGFDHSGTLITATKTVNAMLTITVQVVFDTAWA